MGAMDGARQGTAPLFLLQCVLLDRGVCPCQEQTSECQLQRPQPHSQRTFGLSRPSFRDDMMYIKSKRLRAVRRLQTVLSAVARPPGPRPTSRHHLPCLKAHGRTKLPPNYAATARTRASSGQSTLRTAALTITAPRAQATQTVRYRVRPIARTACMPARVFLGAGFYCAHTPMFENCTETTTRRPIQAGTRVQGDETQPTRNADTPYMDTPLHHCTDTSHATSRPTPLNNHRRQSVHAPQLRTEHRDTTVAARRLQLRERGRYNSVGGTTHAHIHHRTAQHNTAQHKHAHTHNEPLKNKTGRIVQHACEQHNATRHQPRTAQHPLNQQQHTWCGTWLGEGCVRGEV